MQTINYHVMSIEAFSKIVNFMTSGPAPEVMKFTILEQRFLCNGVAILIIQKIASFL